MHPFYRFFNNLFKNIILEYSIAIVAWIVIIFIEQYIEWYMDMPHDFEYWSPFQFIPVFILAVFYSGISNIFEKILWMGKLNIWQLFLLYLISGFVGLILVTVRHTTDFWWSMFYISLPLVMNYIFTRIIQSLRRGK